jgi:hypothetical protein
LLLPFSIRLPTALSPYTRYASRGQLVLLGLVLLAGTQCRRRRESALFLLPPGFVGNVIVVYDQPRGQPPEYRADRRVYRIPPGGVLFTQCGSNNGLGPPDEYRYTDAQGYPRQALRYRWQALATDLPSDTVACCQAPVTDSNTPQTHYLALAVGPNRQLDSLLDRQNALIFSLAESLQKRELRTSGNTSPPSN